MGLEAWLYGEGGDRKTKKTREPKRVHGRKTRAKSVEIYFINFIPGLLTELFDPDTLRGFVKYLSTAGKEAYRVLVLTNILPYVPIHGGTRSLEDVRILLSKKKITEKYSEVNKNVLKRYPELKEEILNLNHYTFALITGSIMEENFKDVKDRISEVIYLWGTNDYRNVAEMIHQELRTIQGKKPIQEKKQKLEEIYKNYKRVYEVTKKRAERGFADAKRKLEEIEKKMELLEDQIEELEKREKLAAQEKKYGRYVIENIEVIKQIIDAIVRQKYFGYIRRALGKHLGRKAKITVRNVYTVEAGDAVVKIGRNFNEILSSRPLKTSIKRMDQRYTRIISDEKTEKARIIYAVEFGPPHYGGFRAVQTKKDNKEVFFVSLPPFGVPREKLVEYGLYKTYKHPATKLLAEPYTEGVVMIRPKEREFLFLRGKFLRDMLKDGEPAIIKLFISGDYHVGAPANWKENLEEIGRAIQKIKPDVIILTGDLLNGIYPEETVYSYVYSQAGNRERVIVNISAQKEALLNGFVGPYLAPYLKGSKASVVLTSGNHFNKSVNSMLDEAAEERLLLEAAGVPEERIYAVHGTEEGAGHIAIDEYGLRILAIHRPRGSPWRDLIYRIIDHAIGTGKTVDLAVAGHYHTGGIGDADGIIAVSAPGLYSAPEYLDELGISDSPKGYITLDVYRLGSGAKAFRAKFHVLE